MLLSSRGGVGIVIFLSQFNSPQIENAVRDSRRILLVTNAHQNDRPFVFVVVITGNDWDRRSRIYVLDRGDRRGNRVVGVALFRIHQMKRCGPPSESPEINIAGVSRDWRSAYANPPLAS